MVNFEKSHDKKFGWYFVELIDPDEKTECKNTNKRERYQ